MSTATTGLSTWTIDQSHSLAEFSVRHLMVSTTRGQFTELSGTLQINEADLTASTIEATINAASVTTRDANRDTHLKSADFFDVEQFPSITFKSTSISKKNDTHYIVKGDLTLHGVTREVELKTQFNGFNTSPWGTRAVGFEADTEISRKEFGLEYNAALESGGVLIGDKVKIHLEVEANPAQ